MDNKLGFGKKNQANKNQEDKNQGRYYKQMIRGLPAGNKPDLGHVIFRLAGYSKVVISVDPAISDILSLILQLLQDDEGRATLSEPLPIGNFGMISGSDLILLVGKKLGTFEITDNLLRRFAFDKCFTFLAQVAVNKRFVKGGQWVIPIKVIDCYSGVQDILDSIDDNPIYHVFFSDDSIKSYLKK